MRSTPPTDWYNTDVIGIDVGPTVLMAENCRSGFVWKTFMSSPEARAALKAAGFRPIEPAGRTLVDRDALLIRRRHRDRSKEDRPRQEEKRIDRG